MANNKSAKKRIQVAERNRLVNKSYKSTVRTLTKKTLANCEKYKQEPNSDNKDLVLVSVNEAFSLIDKAVKKNVLHKNCLLYTSPSPRDATLSRMPSSA